MAWFQAPAITALRREVAADWPGRDTESDGVLGDEAHQGTDSDHNPAYDEPAPFTGIVRALDLDVGGWPALAVRDHLIARSKSGAEKRLWYVISNRTIWSRTWGWTPEPYTRENPHIEHTHYSLVRDMTNFDTSPWLATFGQPPPKPPEEEDDMAFIVTYQGIWLVKDDLSSRTGFSSMADLEAVRGGGRSAKYPIITLTAGQMARIPVAGSNKADLSDEDLAQAAQLNAAAIAALLDGESD